MKLLGFNLIHHTAASAAKPLLAKSLGDIALAGTGVAMAASSVVFAGYMLMQPDHGPRINGMEYLAVFGKPNSSSLPIVIDAPAAHLGKPTSSSHPMVADIPALTSTSGAGAAAPAARIAAAATPVGAIAPRAASDGVDMAPTGSIAREAGMTPVPQGFRILSVEPGVAWLTNGSEIRVIKPGDVAPGFGHVASIEKRDGRWALVDDSGAALLMNDAADHKDGPSPFARRMIFGPSE